MKRLLFILVMISFCCLQEAAGQWNTNGNNIYNSNTGNVGIGNTEPSTLLHVGKDMTEPAITIQNLGGIGGATYTMMDNVSGANWKFKATNSGGFKIRDHANSMDVFVIEPNSAANAIYINGAGNVGIGTDNPVAKLHVADGDAKINALTIGKGGGSISTNSAFGAEALLSNTSGYRNTAIGISSLKYNTTGYENTAVGTYSLLSAETTTGNTAIGYCALHDITTAGYCTAVGGYALFNSKANYNTAVGYDALTNNTYAEGNIAIGPYALVQQNFSNSNTGYSANNIAIGYQALTNNNPTSPGNGINNNATGYRSLYSNTTGYANTGYGHSTLIGNTTGYYNTAVGFVALNDLVTGYQNTAVGYNSGPTSSYPAVYNTTSIGNGASVNASNQVRIGNSNVGSIGGFQDWSNISDGRFKEDVNADVPGLDFISQLHPVTYRLNRKKVDDYTGMTAKKARLSEEYSQPAEDLYTQQLTEVRTGFIAQEVEEAAARIGFDFSGVDAPKNENDFYALRYAEFVVPLVKAVQEQQEIIEDQHKKIDELMKRIEKLEGRK